MRASEIITEYEKGTKNSAEIFRVMQSNGYEKLGDGEEATVWQKDNGNIIKILMPTVGIMPTDTHAFGQADLAFLTFYNFCQDHSDLACLPKFVNIQGAHHNTFKIGGITYRQIAMEKLIPIRKDSANEFMVWMLSDYASTKHDWDTIIHDIMHTAKITSKASSNNKLYYDVERMMNNKYYVYKFKLLLTTMQSLYMEGRRNGLGWDLHTENVMMRANGDLVITDPYYGLS